MVRRCRRDSEFNGLPLHDVPRRRYKLHETVLPQQQARDGDQAVPVAREVFRTRDGRPRVVGLHLLQLEHGTRQRDVRVAGVHLRQHGFAVPHFHATRNHGEVSAARRRLRRAVAVRERGGVVVLAGGGRVGAQLHDEGREVALVRARRAEVLHDDGLLRGRHALAVKQLRQPRLALTAEDVADVERARAVARGHVAVPDVHHAVLPHADGGRGSEAHLACELLLRDAVGRSLVHQGEQVGDGIGRVLLGLRLARIRRCRNGHVHHHVARRDGLTALQLVGEQEITLLRRRVGAAGRIVRVRVHDVVQVHAHGPHDLVLTGHLRAVLEQRRARQRPRRRRVHIDGGQSGAVDGEHDIVAHTVHVAFEREEPAVQRREFRAFGRDGGDNGDILTGNHRAVRVAVAVDHVRSDHLRRGRINQIHGAEVAGEEVILAVDGEREGVARVHIGHVGNAPVDVDAHVCAAGQRGAGRNVLPGVARFLLQLDAVDGHLVGHVHGRTGRGRVVDRIRGGIFGKRRRAKRQHAQGHDAHQHEECAYAMESGRSGAGGTNRLGSHAKPPYRGISLH